MWLLNINTRQLEYFLSPQHVPGGYAILSHTWGKDEPTWDDVKAGEAGGAWTKEGYRKIEFTCRQALRDGYRYAWIDTVCIDKRSSAELSEDINSMFRWYQTAQVCYVYLQDFFYISSAPGSSRPLTAVEETLCRQSRWFTRAWTLQELIAPETVRFYDYSWEFIGDKRSLEDMIRDVTRIDVNVLRKSERLSSMSVAKRMSWASKRSASRSEDLAYSLLGLFDIAMPLLYGEGEVKAFRRLQEEIIRSSVVEDHSILAWLPWESMSGSSEQPSSLNERFMSNGQRERIDQDLLSPSAYGFRLAHNIVSWTMPGTEIFELSNRGLGISALVETSSPRSVPMLLALNCRDNNDPFSHIVLKVQNRRSRQHQGGTARERNSASLLEHPSDIYEIDRKFKWNTFHKLTIDKMEQFQLQSLFLARHHTPRSRGLAPSVHIDLDECPWTIIQSVPRQHAWSRAVRELELEITDSGEGLAAIKLSTDRNGNPRVYDPGLVVLFNITFQPDSTSRYKCDIDKYPVVFVAPQSNLPLDGCPVGLIQTLLTTSGQTVRFSEEAKIRESPYSLPPIRIPISETEYLEITCSLRKWLAEAHWSPWVFTIRYINEEMGESEEQADEEWEDDVEGIDAHMANPIVIDD